MRRYIIEITKDGEEYQAALYQDQRANAITQRVVQLGPQARVKIRGNSYGLSAPEQALADEAGQLEIGQYLYTQILGEIDPNASRQPSLAAVDVRIVTPDEHIARLPWMLHADRGVFLSTTGWSMALAKTANHQDCELPLAPKILVVTPQPEGMPESNAYSHLERIEDLLSGADHRFTQGRHLRMANTWEEFQQAVTEFQPHVVYYYGYASEEHSVFAAGKMRSRVNKPFTDFAEVLRQAAGGPPKLVYLNCCDSEVNGLFGAAWQLSDFVPAVIANRVRTHCEAAQAQALEFWRRVLLDGDPPHTAVVELYGKLDDLNLTAAEKRALTPVAYCHFSNWQANPPKPAPRLQRDPHWRFKLDRVRQFGQVFYQTSQMLLERKPRSLAYVWYGEEGQGVDLFHKRLKFELQEKLADTFLLEVQPEWPMDLHQPHRSFTDMLAEAFAVPTLDQIPGRIRAENRGVSGRRTLVYVRHQPVRSAKLINPGVLKTYLEWWDYNFAPLLEGEVYALLGVSFVVGNPHKFYKALLEKERVDNLHLSQTVFQLLDEMERVVKKDLLDFLNTHNINLPLARKDRVLERILEQTAGHYEMTLDALKDIADRAWDAEDEAKARSEAEPEDYDYDRQEPAPVAAAPQSAKSFDVFLCHNNKDKPAVKQIAAQLQQHGISPWLDEWETRPGVSWLRLLEEQIATIKAAAVFVGSEGLGPWQQQEIEAFLREFVARECPVIPVLLPDAPSEPKLPLFLKGMTWVDFRKSAPDPLQQLIWGITGERGGSHATQQSTPAKSKPIFSSASSVKTDRKFDAEESLANPIKILFLGANPSDTTRLRLDEEIRAIDHAIRQSEFRSRFDLEQHWAVRVLDLQGYLLRHTPQILHFSGHGSASHEIILEDNQGNSQTVSARAISQLFSVLKDNIRCVVLNACYSEPQARAIAEHIDCVIGMSKAIGDEAAINFSTAFYQALGYGRDVKTAFDLGCVQINLEGLEEEDTPKLIALRKNPRDIFFV